MADELQKHLDNSRYGTPQIKPEEQHRYLGTFRERCYLSMTMQQMQDSTWQAQFAKHLPDYPEAEIRINGNLPESLQATYLHICAQAQRNFTIIQTNEAPTLETIGLLLVNTQAVDEPIIDIAQKWPEKNSSTPEQSPKPSFLQKWFHL